MADHAMDRSGLDDVRVANALEAGGVADAVSRAVVITGGSDSTDIWREALSSAVSGSDRVRVLPEQGRKGNFLGALQAYSHISSDAALGGIDSIEQLVMFVGTGSRLSPITQSLRNMKAALLLPSGDATRAGLTVGEAAVRSSAPWIRSLRAGGFTGLVVRWGDEIIVPSTPLATHPGQFSDVDAVRFGYYARPTELLASQKEWLLADEHDNVYAELPRQPLDRLLDQVSRYRSVKALHVNLGSFAISYALLDALGAAFGDLVGADEIAANWDPYLWMALHSSSLVEWESDCRAGRTEVPRDFAQLVEAIPDFWRRTQEAKRLLSAKTGRAFATRVLDFGDPYWFDAGNHASLRSGINDIFSPGRDGETIRAFLELPGELAEGGSLVLNSQVVPGVELNNSILIGSEVGDAASFLDRTIVINSRVGRLRADPGSVVIECVSPTLEIDGPESFAVRLEESAHVRGDEITAGVPTARGSVRLSHFDPYLVIDNTRFETRLWANPFSFEVASGLVSDRDPDA